MSTNISSIAELIDEKCHSQNCKSGKCSIDLTDMPSPPKRLIVNMDCDELRIPTDSKRCDYVIFLDNPFDERNDSIIIIPIEMKSGKVHGVTNIIKQIEYGIKFANQRIDRNTPHTFIPILVHNGIHSKNYNGLKTAVIKISNNRKSRLILMKCGERLIDKLHQK